MTARTFKAKLIIFDLDGTLIEFPKTYLFSEVRRILQDFDHPEVHDHHLEDSFSRFEFFDFIHETIRNTFIESYWEKFDWIRYPKPSVIIDAHETLAHYHSQGLHLAIATARPGPSSAIVSELEEHTNLMDFITTLAARETDDKHWSDKQEQILRVCETFGVSPTDAMLVGDIPSDIISAKKAGIGTSVAVLSGGIRESTLRATNPDFIFSDVSELMRSLLLY